MTRGLVDDLRTSRPLGEMLPALYHGDDFAQRLTSSFDVALAPVIATLDDLDAYLDSQLAPSDFVEWLATWVGLLVDETWSLEMLRRLVAQAVELYHWRGTVRGLVELVGIYTDGTAEVIESGGTGWSARPDSEMPGDASHAVTVRISVGDPSSVDLRRLGAVVSSAVPAHIACTVEVIGR